MTNNEKRKTKNNFR